MQNAFDLENLFGLESTPVVKKTKNEKKKSSTGKKKTSKNDSKETYKLPITVYSEYGEFIVEDNGEEVTLSEIGKMLPFELTVKKYSDYFVGIPKNQKVKDVISGILVDGGIESEIDSEDSKSIIEKFGESDTELVEIAKNTYSFRFKEKDALNWDFQLKGSFFIGFKEFDCMMEVDAENSNKDYNLKEAATKFINEHKWLEQAEKAYFYQKVGNRQCIFIQLYDKKIESKGLRVKLPCGISFLHPAGKLANGLTSEMFDGKEYVDEEDILKKVDEFFTDIYKKNNTSINYIENINTVCVQHIGRSKGSTIETEAASFEMSDSGKLTYKSKIKPIPFEFINKVYNIFLDNMPNEAIVQIVYDFCLKRYRIYVPKAVKGCVSVSWDDAETIQNLSTTESVIMEIHSHNKMKAYFSSIDDQDETLPMLYGVMGDLGDGKKGSFVIRAGCAGKFEMLDVSAAFEIPKLLFNGKIPIIVLASNNNKWLFMDLESGDFITTSSVYFYANGSICWDHASYHGSDIFNLNWDRMKEEFVSGNNYNYVVIKEILEKKIKLEGRNIENVRNEYDNSDIILDSSDFKDVFFIGEEVC